MGNFYFDSKGDIQYNDNDEPLQLRSTTEEGAETELAAATAKFGTGIYLPGLVAYMPGWKGIWQMKDDGTWEKIVQGDEDSNE